MHLKLSNMFLNSFSAILIIFMCTQYQVVSTHNLLANQILLVFIINDITYKNIFVFKIVLTRNKLNKVGRASHPFILPL